MYRKKSREPNADKNKESTAEAKELFPLFNIKHKHMYDGNDIGF
jgi:hypothetical protein